MKVLLVTHYYSTHRGGIELVAGNLARLLARVHDIVWAASDCDPLPGPGEAALTFAPMRSTNVFERRTGVPYPLWGPRSLHRLWQEARNADVVHVHDSVYPGNCAAVLFAIALRKPVVITQHVGFVPYRNPALRGALRLMYATVGRFVLGRADRVVFVSKIVRDYFAAFVPFRQPPLVIANGVDTELFVPPVAGERARARELLGLEEPKPVLLFVGRFVEKKGLRILQQLVRRLSDVSWLFAGWGPIDPRSWNAPNVRVFVDRRGAGLVPLYHAASLLVLPSVGEGLPLVVQEAMSCGVPVLVGEDTAAAVGAPGAFARGCKVGGPNPVDAWETAIRGLLAEEDRLSQLQRDIAAFARGTWSWEGSAAAYESVLEHVARERGIPSTP